MLVAGVVDDEVHDDLEPALVRAGDQLVDVGEATEQRVDVLVVADVVAIVVLRRLVDRRQPNHVNPQRGKVIELRDDAMDVTDAIAI